MQDKENYPQEGVAQSVNLQEIQQKAPGANLYNGNLELIKNLKVKLQVVVGEAEVSVEELFALKENAVLDLNRLADAPLDIYLDGRQIARGKLVVVEENFGICITEIAHGQDK